MVELLSHRVAWEDLPGWFCKVAAWPPPHFLLLCYFLPEQSFGDFLHLLVLLSWEFRSLIFIILFSLVDIFEVMTFVSVLKPSPRG